MAKLTLSVDDTVVTRAKEYAKQRGVSVSKVVQDYLAAIADPVAPSGTPVLDSVRGILKKVDVEDYRQHLAAKHG